MSTLNLSDFFLAALADYGPPALALALFLGAAGLPIPSGLLLLAAGAAARQGTMAWAAVSILGLVGVVLGDGTSYALGRWAGGWSRCRAAAWQAALARFERHGALSLYLTRVLFTSLDVPTNLVAGSSRYAARRFLAWDIAGRATWLALYGGLGYAFGSRWPAVSQALGTYGTWLAAAAALLAGSFLLARWWYDRRRASPVRSAL